jgi:hypothetical protein
MQFLLGHINSPVVLPKLWEMKKPLVQSGLVAMFYKDPATLPRVLQICQDVCPDPLHLFWRSLQAGVDW